MISLVKNLAFDIFNIKIMKLQSQIIILDSVQLHLFSIISASLQILVFMNLKIEEFNVENIKSQLNQDTLNLMKDFADILIQTL